MENLKLGTHIICEATKCNTLLLNDEKFLIDTLVTACKLGGAGVISVQSHHFSPQGVTVLVLLSESHTSIHSWPELGYASIDCYTCGDVVNPKVIVDYIVNSLGAIGKIKEIDRGIFR